jgi:DNA-binding transcriptional LysR family regulator
MAVAVASGMGVGLIPIYSAISGLRNGSLVWLLPEYTSQAMNLYALYPSRQYLDAKIRTWIEHLREELPATLAADQEELRQFART